MSNNNVKNPMAIGSDPKETNPQKETNKGNPSKPGTDPDQTPERETKKPPVAAPEKGTQKPGKVGF